MNSTSPEIKKYTSFVGNKKIASGDLLTVALATKKMLTDKCAPILIFADDTAEQTEIDLRGTEDELRNRIQMASTQAEMPIGEFAAKGPGRPKLGVVAREITLLPRHWEWLNQQPGGASVAIRKLVEEARRAKAPFERLRLAQDRTYKLMSCLAGNLEGFEESARALFANDFESFIIQIGKWPPDVRDYVEHSAQNAFDKSSLH
jgi:hypothetical protein